MIWDLGSFPSPLSSHRTDGITPVNLAGKHQEHEAGIGQGEQQLCDVQMETLQWGPCCTAAAIAELKICLTLLKSDFAWFVCTACYSLPGVYHTFSSCLQNAVITNCKNQPRPHLIRVKPAQLCSVSSVSGLLSTAVWHMVIAQRCFSLLLSDLFIFSRVLGLGPQKCFVTIATGAHTSLADGHDRTFCRGLTWPFPMQIYSNKPEHLGGPVFIYSQAGCCVCHHTPSHQRFRWNPSQPPYSPIPTPCP